MATIDKLDISVYNMYAVRTRLIEQINQQLHLEEAATIPPQTSVITTQIQLSEIDLLLGVVPMQTPWAYFFPPKRFNAVRRSPFTFAKVAPSINDTGEQGKAFAALVALPCDTTEEESEKGVILLCFKELSKLNNWLGFIVGRIGQFLQG
jgi:hypothetical protein